MFRSAERIYRNGECAFRSGERTFVSVSTMTYCVVQINCLPLPRFFKEVTMKTAEERYEETWNSYLELLNKDPRASLVSFTKLKSV